ncbi:MAG: hypothetical protein HY371_03795, partial [Devosia nanyangense]|nr:hypothetical protein [Devosia nanyangense]
FGDRPVIAAGSTGSIPATANLLGALSRLPRGALVLPGLDPDLDYPRLLKPEESPHGHPQYGLAQLLRRLGVPPDAVVELGAPGPRFAVIRQALALPEGTARWAQARAALAPQLAEATDGITILGARTADEEARAIALAARDGLMHGKTIGIVSPDRNLARRIAAELLRFDLEVDDAAGSPLFHAPAGRLVRQILSLAGNAFAPVDLVALLRNRSVVLGMERAEVARLADYLETRLLAVSDLLRAWPASDAWLPSARAPKSSPPCSTPCSRRSIRSARSSPATVFPRRPSLARSPKLSPGSRPATLFLAAPNSKPGQTSSRAGKARALCCPRPGSNRCSTSSWPALKSATASRAATTFRSGASSKRACKARTC